MMRWIIRMSLKFRFLIVAVAAALMFVGAGQLGRMPVDVFPEFAPPRVEIQTPCLGLVGRRGRGAGHRSLWSRRCTGCPGSTTLRSKSVSQLSPIELIFEGGTDLIEARQLVPGAPATVMPTLPSWAARRSFQPLSATSRVMKIGISSDTDSTIDMSMIAYWNDPRRLLGVPGVANVAIWGERLEMLQVQVDPDRMQGQQGDARGGHGGHRRRARRGAAAVLRRLGNRHGRHHRDPEPAAHGPATSCRSSRRRTSAEVVGHRRRESARRSC